MIFYRFPPTRSLKEMYENQSREFVCGFFFKVQSALSDYVGLVLNYLIIHGLCQFTQFKIQSYDKIFKIRFCFPKRRENPGYAYACLQVFGQYGTFLFNFLVSCSFSKSNLRGLKSSLCRRWPLLLLD